jgi:hypothetical protein
VTVGLSALSAAVHDENVALREQIGSPFEPTHAFVAILDALGVRTYSRQQVKTFLDSRQLVLEAAATLAEKHLKRFDKLRLSRFAFQDTVIICYRLDDTSPRCIPDFETASHLLRAFEMLSLRRGVLFRGAYSLGEVFHVSEADNTVMGPTVSDAAAWYEKADWIGIHATPGASATSDELIRRATDDLAHLLVQYPVPMKDGSSLNLRAINWPKGFYVEDLAPLGSGRGREKLQALLDLQPPSSDATRRKHGNAVAFFESVHAAQDLRRWESATPSHAASEADSDVSAVV